MTFCRVQVIFPSDSCPTGPLEPRMSNLIAYALKVESDLYCLAVTRVIQIMLQTFTITIFTVITNMWDVPIFRQNVSFSQENTKLK